MTFGPKFDLNGICGSVYESTNTTGFYLKCFRVWKCKCLNFK